MFENFLHEQAFGHLRGSVSRTGMIDVIADGAARLPRRGDFALVKASQRMLALDVDPTPDRERLLVLRVTSADLTGTFAEGSDRGQEYLANFGRFTSSSDGVPNRVRELAVRHRLQAIPLGWLKREGQRATFEPGFRDLNLFGEPVYSATPEALETLVNLGLEHEPPASVVRLGRYARGHEATATPVSFSINRLKGKRTFVFARAGYGKSNLTKLLLSRLFESPPDVGLLIVDPDGEYAFDQVSETGETIVGFANRPGLAERVTVFTARKYELAKNDPRIMPIGLDLRELTADEFVTLFVDSEKLEQVWVNRLRALHRQRAQWRNLVDLLATRGYHASDEEIADAIGARVQSSNDRGKAGPDVVLGAIRNNIAPVVARLHKPEAKLLSVARAKLLGRKGIEPGVVILDVSMLPGRDADAVVRALLWQVFREAVDSFTKSNDRMPGVLLVLEEAQSVLGGGRLDDRDIYVRWVKEGRKYGLGSMMITQQPGSLSSELISQGDNFFAMHLLNQRDLDSLGSANAHFSPEILDFIRSEPVKGNCYFWSAPNQPYVVPVRVDSYEQVALAKQAATQPAPMPAPAPAPTPRYSPVGEAVLEALLGNPKAWLFRVTGIGGKPTPDTACVVAGYLGAAAHEAVLRRELSLGDTVVEQGYERLRDDLLVRAFDELGITAHPAFETDAVDRRKRLVLFYRPSALARLADDRGRTPRAVRGELVVG